MKNLFKVNFIKSKFNFIRTGTTNFFKFNNYTFANIDRSTDSLFIEKLRKGDTLSNTEYLDLINLMKSNQDLLRDNKIRETLTNQLSNHISEIKEETLNDLTEILTSSDKLPSNKIIEMVNKRHEQLERSSSRGTANKTQDSSEYNNNSTTNQVSEERTEIFVSNLPYRITEQELGEVFSPFADVHACKIVLDRETGRSRGFAFVKFASSQIAREVAEKANNLEVQGRNIRVNVAEPKTRTSSSQPRNERNEEEREPRQRSTASSSSSRGSTEFSIFVGNLNFRTDERNLEDFFSDCGTVTGVRVPTSPEGRSRGFAFVTFDSQASMEAALRKNDMELDGRRVRLDLSSKSGGSSSSSSRSGDYRGGSSSSSSSYGRSRSQYNRRDNDDSDF